MNILLLGATSDIARALIYRIAKAGDRVFLAGRNRGELESMASDLAMRKGVETMVGVFDAAASETHPRFVADAVERLGGLDGAVLAVGYLGEQEKAQTDPHEAETIIQMNFTSAVGLLEPVAAELEKRRSGWILGLSSVAGVRRWRFWISSRAGSGSVLRPSWSSRSSSGYVRLSHVTATTRSCDWVGKYSFR